MNVSFNTSAIGSRETASSRTSFIKKTYLHLLLNVTVFSVLTLGIITTPITQIILGIASNGIGWLLILMAFGFGAGILQSVAFNSNSKPVQYSALFGFILLEAIIFSPIALIGLVQGVLFPALLATILLFGVLTLSVLITKTNYNFLRGFLVVSSLAAFGIIALGLVFNLSIFNTLFTVLMIVLMCGWILYDTSKIAREYPTSKYIAASIAIFADFVTLLWYVVRLLSGSRR